MMMLAGGWRSQVLPYGPSIEDGVGFLTAGWLIPCGLREREKEIIDK
jgi:hypothetical protein